MHFSDCNPVSQVSQVHFEAALATTSDKQGLPRHRRIPSQFALDGLSVSSVDELEQGAEGQFLQPLPNGCFARVRGADR